MACGRPCPTATLEETMNDGTHTYTRHTDAELSSILLSIDIEKNPRNARNLAEEIERRWLATKDQLSETVTANVVATGARFSDLAGVAASRFFWSFFWRLTFVGLAFGIGILFLQFGVALLLAVVAMIAGQSREGAQELSRYALLLTSLMVMVPYARFLLREITSRTFGGYAIRIVHAEKGVLPVPDQPGPRQDPPS
jgi:hypothetical protein